MGQRLAHLVMHMTQVAHYRDINNPYLPLLNSRCCKTAIDKWHKETNLFIIIALRIVLACVVAYTEYDVDIITEYTNMHWVLLGTVPVPGGSEFWEFRRTAWGKRDPPLSARLFPWTLNSLLNSDPYYLWDMKRYTVMDTHCCAAMSSSNICREGKVIPSRAGLNKKRGFMSWLLRVTWILFLPGSFWQLHSLFLSYTHKNSVPIIPGNLTLCCFTVMCQMFSLWADIIYNAPFQPTFQQLLFHRVLDTDDVF